MKGVKSERLRVEIYRGIEVLGQSVRNHFLLNGGYFDGICRSQPLIIYS